MQRQIDVTFKLASGSYSGTDGDVVKLTGLRALASIEKAGGASMGGLQLRVFGVPLDLMNQLSTLGLIPTALRRNTVTVAAGDVGGTIATVFVGTIKDAWADFNNMPDVSFNVSAFAGTLEAVTPIPPTSVQGTGDAATTMQGMASQVGLGFENSGVQTKLSNSYFAGSAKQQIDACAEEAGVEQCIDNGILAIYPKNGSRGDLVPLISAQTGMIGYPTFSSYGISVRTLFVPSLVYGALIKVQSDLTPACGTWRVFKLTYDLESLEPGGQWFQTIEASRPDYVPVP